MEDNQRLTSSNKLFDYISAGLAVISPNLPGLSETLNEYNVGLQYEAGNTQMFAEQIEFLSNNKQTLINYKKNSIECSNKSLFWENDYQHVLTLLQK